MLKRVVAVAGETIQCCDAQNRVVVNGSPLDEPYLYYLPNAGPAQQESFPPVAVPAGMVWRLNAFEGVGLCFIPYGMFVR